MTKTLTLKLKQTHDLIESVGGLMRLHLLRQGSLSARHLLRDLLLDESSVGLGSMAGRDVAGTAGGMSEEPPCLLHLLHLLSHLLLHETHVPAVELGGLAADLVAFFKALGS